MRNPIKILVALIPVISILSACQKPKDEQQASQDDRFNTFKESFIEAMWKLYPVTASSMGYHNYDSVLIVPDQASIDAEIAFASAFTDSLKFFDESLLSVNNRTDYLMIRDQLNYILWSAQEYKSDEWDLSSYNVNGTFAEMLNNNYDALETRLRNFYLRMKNVPAYYAAAKSNIINPTIEHTQLAIEQNLGGVTVFEDDLKQALDTAKLEGEEKQEILARARDCITAVVRSGAFAVFLEKCVGLFLIEEYRGAEKLGCADSEETRRHSRL